MILAKRPRSDTLKFCQESRRPPPTWHVAHEMPERHKRALEHKDNSLHTGNSRKQKYIYQLWLETKQTLSQNLTLFTDWERMHYVCFMRILSLCWHCTVLPGEYGARAFCLRVKTMDLANAQNATITIGGSSLRIILYMKRHDCIIENTHYIYNTHTAEGSRFQTWIYKAKREGGAVTWREKRGMKER